MLELNIRKRHTRKINTNIIKRTSLNIKSNIKSINITFIQIIYV